MPGQELTTADRAMAHGMSVAGMTTRDIATHFGVHHSTIVRTIARAKELPEDDAFKSKPRSYPRKTTKQQDQQLQ